MITERSSVSLGIRRKVVDFVGLSTDTKPVYWKCLPQPTKSEFETSKTHYYTLKDGSYTQCSGDEPYCNLAAYAENIETTTVSVDSPTYLSKTTETMEFVCEVNSASKSVTAKDKSFTTASVTLTKATLFTQIQTAGTHNFVYDGSKWKLNNAEVVLADYGLEIADGVTLTAKDKIAVTVTVKWQSGGEDITLSAYGITVTGNATKGDSFAIGISSAPKTFYEVQQLNGSEFTEMDTKKKYLFDEAGAAWIEQ